MKRYASWLFVAIVLALLLTLGLGPDRPMRVFLDSPIWRASCLDVSRLLVPAVAVMVPAVRPAKFWCTWKQDRVGQTPTNGFLCFPTSLSTVRRCTQTILVRLGSISVGPPVLVQAASRLKLQGPAGPAKAIKVGELPSEPVKTGAPARIGVLQRVIFRTGFS
jgi:hypothetical protein